VAKVFATVATTTSGERGLLGLALSPSFASNHYVYAMYAEPDGLHQTIVRWTDCAGTGTQPTTIVSGLPGGTTCCHKGGRIAFGPDGFLYATLGDLHSAPALNAQDPCDPRGKVLRYTAGGAPAGVGCGANWVSGLRNSFGLAFAPDGTLALTNNGPSGDAGTPCGSCGDEFYLVGKGGGVNYQWPYCWGYTHPLPSSNNNCHNLPAPQYSTEGGPYAKNNPFFIAPTGIAYANGHFLFCAQSPAHVYQYVSNGLVVDTGIGGCSLDIKQGPDGALFTSDAGTIYRH
jgi:glucose/arabinose dehydrogenase